MIKLDEMAERIRILCDQNGTTINKMLKEAGLSVSIVDNLKRGSMPSADKIERLADYFNVSVDYILGRVESESSLTKHEKKVVSAYRERLDMQSAVDRLLGLNDK